MKDELKPEYSAEQLVIRKHWISKMVAGVFSRRGFDLSPEKVAFHVELWEPALNRIATEQLETVYEIGSAKLATSAEMFVMFWEMKNEAEQRERQHEKQKREFAKRAANAATADSPVRAAIFAKWESQGVHTVH